jgi:hypothetical protein
MLRFLKLTSLSLVVFLVSYSEGSQTYPLDIEGFHKVQRENVHTDPYLHTKALFDAIHSGKKHFEKKELKEEVNKERLLSLQAFHTTTTKITLFPENNYISLDDPSVSKNIQTIEPVSLIDCNNHLIQIGDYYIGTSHSTHNDVMLYSNQGSKVGFIFSRQVVGVKELSGGCKRVITMVVHPLQIMNTYIETAISFPYDRVYIPNDAVNNTNPKTKTKTNTLSNRRLRGKNDAFMEPDAPLLECSDDEVTSKMATIHKTGEDSTTIKGIPFDYSYALDVKGNECLYADATVPGSINYNHASGTNAIRQNIVLGNGATCTKCYSFMGASVLAVFNIFGGKMSTFAFQAKGGGGAGFNIGILIKDPSFSASKYLSLAGPGKTSSIPIVAGLSLDIRFGGAWATIKGSGSAKGEARFSSGYTLYEEDSIMYSKSKWTAHHELTNSNQLNPVYSISGFKVSSMSLSAIISLSARVEFSFGGSIPVVNVGASVDFSSILTATSQFVKSGKSNYNIVLGFSDLENRILIDSVERNTKYPGDKIRFHVNYEGLNPNEIHELYFNLHHHNTNSDSSSGFPIKKHTFKSSRGGKGTVVVDWTVPHDSRLMQSDDKDKSPKIHFSVHSSARLDRFRSDMKIRLIQKKDAEVSSIFKYPHDNSIIPTGQKMEIKWEKDKMKYFRHKPGTDGLGEDKVSPKVSLIIVAINNKNESRAYQLLNNIENIGTYEAVLPDILHMLGDKFFLVIHDANEYSKIAWHHGVFRLTPPRRRIPLNATNGLEPVYVEPPIVEHGVPLWGNNTQTLEIPELINMDRRLVTCPNSALSIMLQIEFGFDGFTLLGKKYTLGSTHSNPFVIIPQKNLCI